MVAEPTFGQLKQVALFLGVTAFEADLALGILFWSRGDDTIREPFRIWARRLSKSDRHACIAAFRTSLASYEGNFQVSLDLSGGTGDRTLAVGGWRSSPERRKACLAGIGFPEGEGTGDALLAGFFRDAPMSFFIKDREGRYAAINREAERLFAAKQARVLGARVGAFYPLDLAARIEVEDDRVLRSGSIVLQERQAPIGDSQRWFVNAKFPIRMNDGRMVAIGGIDVDIDERKRLERALMESETLLRTIIDAVPAAIAVQDIEGTPILSNAAMRELASVATGNGAPLHILADDTAGNGFREVQLATPAGRRSYLATTVVARSPSKGHSVTVAVDITHRKLVERELEAAKAAADQANRAKSIFLAAASHDLRQPLQALELFVAALQTRLPADHAGAVVTDMRSCLQSMQQLLDALLDISQLEAGTIAPKFERVSLASILARIEREHAMSAEAQGLEFEVHPTRARVTTDPVLLARIIANFVSNAIRYTPRGGRVVVSCRSHGAHRVRIAVSDTGIGIKSAELGQIFDDFYQVQGEALDRSRGLGLGLAIARRLGLLLDHRISVRSKPDHGSVFQIEVPLAARARPVGSVGSQPDDALVAGASIMIIEDDPAIGRALALVVQDWGANATICTRGEDAEALAMADRAPDVIIADYNLRNGETGLEVIGKIRRLAARSIPALLVTGEMQPEPLRELANSGIVTLSKPVQPMRLKQAINNALGRRDGGAPTPG